MKVFCKTDKKVIGKMKDGSERKIVDEFGWKWKSKDENQRCIPWKILMVKNLMQKKEGILIEFNEFKDALFNKKVLRHKMRRIQGKKHKMGTYEINKISLSCFDDKRFVLNDGIHTLAYFHKDLKNRFSQMIINKKRFKKILIKRRGSNRWSQIKISAYK